MEHNHGHEHGCECGHHHHHQECGCEHAAGGQALGHLSAEEKAMLLKLSSRGPMAAASFGMGSSQSSHCHAVAMSPVLLENMSDTPQDVRDRCTLLNGLMRRDLVVYRDDATVCEHAAQAYRDSEVFEYFKDTVREGSAMPGFLFDTPLLQMGCVALTELGERALEK